MVLTNSTAVKGADFAIAAVEAIKANPNADARKAMAAAAIRIGNYDDAGKAAWQSYLDAGCPQASAR